MDKTVVVWYAVADMYVLEVGSIVRRNGLWFIISKLMGGINTKYLVCSGGDNV